MITTSLCDEMGAEEMEDPVYSKDVVVKQNVTLWLSIKMLISKMKAIICQTGIVRPKDINFSKFSTRFLAS